MDCESNPKYQQFLQNCVRPDVVQVYQRARAVGIQKIFELHAKKAYKIETLFCACNIFDRYLQLKGHWNFPLDKIICLSTISMLLAAKLEQPMQPSFSRMLTLLSESEQELVTRQDLVALEADILLTFGFDFNFPGPMDSL